VHDKHRHVIILLVTCEHAVNQILQEPFGVADNVFGSTCGYRDKLIKSGVEAAPSVLDQPVGIEHRGGSRRQAERVLLPRAGPA
jgi:hypothetical protein